MNKRTVNQAVFVTSYFGPGMARPVYRLRVDVDALPELEPWRDLDAVSVENVRAAYIVVNAIRAAVLAGKGKTV